MSKGGDELGFKAYLSRPQASALSAPAPLPNHLLDDRPIMRVLQGQRPTFGRPRAKAFLAAQLVSP
jgi:hypothetical protein